MQLWLLSSLGVCWAKSKLCLIISAWEQSWKSDFFWFNFKLALLRGACLPISESFSHQDVFYFPFRMQIFFCYLCGIKSLGHFYGPSFQSIEITWAKTATSVCKIILIILILWNSLTKKMKTRSMKILLFISSKSFGNLNCMASRPDLLGYRVPCLASNQSCIASKLST